MLLNTDRVGVFIDWDNIRTTLELISSMKNKKLAMPWEEMKDAFTEFVLFARFYLYAGEGGTEVQELAYRLRGLGYNVLLKRSQQIAKERGWQNRKNTDVEMATDICFSGSLFNHIIIFSGDGDFSYLVEALKARDKRVTVISYLNPTNSEKNTTARALVQEADTFVQIEDFIEAVKSGALVGDA